MNENKNTVNHYILNTQQIEIYFSFKLMLSAMANQSQQTLNNFFRLCPALLPYPSTHMHPQSTL